MKELDRYMSELFRIISGALRLDTAKVRNYAAFLAEKLEGDGETQTAARLRKLLDDTDHQLKPANVGLPQVLPVDSESRFGLLERIELRGNDEIPIVLNAKQQDLANEFISVVKSQGQLEANGIDAPATLLLFGPPGCGKSRLARHVAKELGRDLYVARLDGLISSFLGSTSKNIRSIFQFASSTPCVLLLDEFDAIAKLRDDKQELGELKRVVTSFLQNLDSLGAESTIIAATNHEKLLDPAVWRRFNYTLELGYPERNERISLWMSLCGANVKWSSKNLEVLADLSEGFSGAEIKDVCVRMRRQQVLGMAGPALKEAFTGLLRIAAGQRERQRFLAQLVSSDGPNIVHALRERNPKLYSHSEIASLLGTSKATAYRWKSQSKVSQ